MPASLRLINITQFFGECHFNFTLQFYVHLLVNNKKSILKKLCLQLISSKRIIYFTHYWINNYIINNNLQNSLKLTSNPRHFRVLNHWENKLETYLYCIIPCLAGFNTAHQQDSMWITAELSIKLPSCLMFCHYMASYVWDNELSSQETNVGSGSRCCCHRGNLIDYMSTDQFRCKNV